jgi:hypothetical protein
MKRDGNGAALSARSERRPEFLERSIISLLASSYLFGQRLWNTAIMIGSDSKLVSAIAWPWI